MPMGITRKRLANLRQKVNTPTVPNKPSPKRRAANKLNAKRTLKDTYKLNRKVRARRLTQTQSHPSAIMAKHDAYGKKTPLPTPYHSSKFNTMNGLIRATVNLDPGWTAIMICFWVPNGLRCIINYKTGPTTVVGTAVDRLSCYQTEVPVTMRHLRQSIKIRNVTKADNVAGTVRTLLMTEQPANITVNSAQTIHPAFDVATYDNFVNYCRGQNETVSFTAAELRATRHFPLVPGHSIAHQDYQKWYGYTDVAGIANMYIMAGEKEAVLPMLFLFEAPGASQTYDISIHAQDACQYAAASALTLLAYAPTVSSTEQHEHEKKVMELNAARGEYESALSKWKTGYKAKTTQVGTV